MIGRERLKLARKAKRKPLIEATEDSRANPGVMFAIKLGMP